MAARRTHRPLAWTILIAFVITLGVGVSTPRPAAASGDPCAPLINPVACENSKPGQPASQWDSANGGDTSIQGFATDMSVNIGQTVHFKINTPAPSYHIDIYRIGYYQGNGARFIGSATVTAALPQTQPACLTDATTQLIDCGNWSESASWAVPTNAVSGVFIAHLIRDDTGGDSQIPFIVRDDARHSDIVYQTSDTTWQAYNDWGGVSLYTSVNGGRGYKVSYNRPFATRADTPDGRDYFFGSEYPAVRFLEANGYDVSYLSGIDSDRSGSLLLNHSTFLSVGHDEYWSGNQRANVEAARDAGVNLAFLSGNEIYWKTRWEPSIDGSNTPYRTLVTYKETKANAKIDPSPQWTGTWRDPRFSPPSDGGRPENGLSGTWFIAQDTNSSIQVPQADGLLRLWRNTDIATQAPGGVTTLPLGTLGYEWDEDPDNGFRPAGLFDQSSTTLTNAAQLLDYGSTVGPGTATHHITTYRAASGALVYSMGTIQWSWGLDSNHDGTGPPTDSRMQQATVNMLADMNAQPGTLLAGLVPATKSTDTAAPTATITSPAPGATLTNGSLLTVTGTAADTGGGRVAAVEVSTDGGSTWHRATGRESWTYTTSATGLGATTIKARAVDDSGNLQSSPTSINATVSCPCSIFGLASTPVTPASTDTNAVELGVKFQSDVNGWVTGVRFYKGTGNTGTHTGTLWDTAGNVLASATFTSETASGWQEASFGAPVAITAGSTYVVSYYAPTGHYAADSGYFATASTPNAPLHGLAAGISGPNGVYIYGAHAFPVNSYGSTNYWVDAVMSTNAPPDTVPPTVTSRTPLAGSSSVLTSTQPTATFSEAVQSGTISFVVTDTTNAVIPGSVSYNGTTRTATFAPTSALPAGTTLTATVSGVQDLVGNVMTAPVTWSFTTAAPTPPPGVCPCSIWTDSTVPTVITTNDAKAVELGVRFTSDSNGTITGVRFYKGPSNTGVHTGSLWTSTGTLLATATFSSESTTGWQTVTFASPVNITAGTTYVASYHTNAGYYSSTSGTFTSGKKVDNAPLHAPTTAAGAPNGAYLYGTGGFPTNGNGSNYWVDVVFVPGADTSPPTVVGRSPELGATSVPVGTAVKATMSEPIQPASASMTLTGPGGAAVAGTVTYNSTTNQVVFTPTAALAAGTTYTATVSGALDLSGNVMTAPVTWSFTTSGSTACPCTLWSTDTVPAVPASTDAKEVEVGVRFTPDADGWIAGVRFYKGSTNTGTHTGSLWTSTGTLLATATFTGESATGWQQVAFPAPIHVTAGQTYVASYHAPVGHYAAAVSYFTSPLDNSPLHAPASVVGAGNGVYRYGATAFPTSTSNATNYWVDVSFSTTPPPDLVPPTITAVDPVNGATSVAPTATPSATFSEAVDPTSVVFTLTGPSGSVAGTVGYDSVAHKVTFTPSAALANSTNYTATVSAANDLAGNPLAAPVSWSFTTAQPTAAVGVCPCLIWPDAVGPAQPSTTDSQGVEVGTKFRADSNGWITGIRFFKGSTNTGTHTGTLWDITGNALATGTFTGESVAGWQQLTFATPVAITANTTYIASYHTPTGHYAATVGAFASAGVDRGPLHALKTGVDGVNGVYTYGAGGVAPATGIDSNYWVQPVYDTQPTRTPPVISAVNASSTLSPAGDSVTETITWTTDTASDSTVLYGTSSALGSTASTPGLTTSHSVVIPGLAPNTTYSYRVTSADQYANLATSPNPPAAPSTFLTAPDTVAPTIISTSPVSGTTSVSPSATASATFSEAVQPGGFGMTLAGPSGLVGGTVSYNAVSRTVTFTPTSPLSFSTTYTATVNTGKDLAGNPLAAPVSWSFTTAQPTAAVGVCPCLIWPDAVGPAQPATTDNQGIEVGTKFRADNNGWITGIRFYKGSTNTGTHTGTLWDNNGNALATGTFTGESVAGWQQLNFPTAVPITANTTYIASYYAPNGDYAETPGAFASAGVDLGPLHALQTGVDGVNGVYTYGAGGVVPSTGIDSNYWVQPVYDTVPERIAPVSTSLAATGSGTTATVTWTTDEPATSTVLYGTSSSNLNLSTTIAGLSTNHSVSLTGLTVNAPYYFRVQSTDQWGNAGTTPAAPAAPAVYIPTTVPFRDTTAADFGAGTLTNTAVGSTGDGEVTLIPTVAADFNDTAVPAGWTTTPWASGGTATVGGGSLTVDGATVGTTATYTRPRSLEFTATFQGTSQESAGFGIGYKPGEAREVFTNDIGGGALYAVTQNVFGTTRTTLAVNPTAPHRFRIDWTASGVVYTVDGTVVASHTATPTVAMRPLFSDTTVGLPSALVVDWVRMGPYNGSGTFLSRVFAAGRSASWGAVTWNAEVPTGTTMVVSVRSGNWATPNGFWTAWKTITNPGDLAGITGNYAQYRVQFTSAGSHLSSPRLSDLTLAWAPIPT